MTTTKLTELYVHEVVRRLPAAQRDDIALELRTTIADTVDARGDGDPQAAERAVLKEMGDPVSYAARYSERPLALIGPDLYPAYMRLLTVLLLSVLPLVTVVFVVMDIADGEGLGTALEGGVGTVLTVGAQMVAVLTLVFALAERSRRRDGSGVRAMPWSPDELPGARQQPDKGAASAVAGAAWDALLIGLIVWQHTNKPYKTDTDGERVAVLDPALWSGWIWPLLVGLGCLVVVSLVRVAARGWTVPLAAGFVVGQAAFSLSLAWILYEQRLFNPEFLVDANRSWTTPDEAYTGAAVIVLAIGASAIFKCVRAVRGVR